MSYILRRMPPSFRTSVRRHRIPLAMTAAVIVLSGHVDSVTDSTGNPTGPGTHLEVPRWYVATSPVSRTLDAMTLLSTPQTIAVLVTAAVIALAFGAGRSRDKARSARFWSASIAAAIAIAAMVEGIVALAPRPMAALRVADPEVVTADFHSHTGASHDVRKSFSAEDNRRWHRDGGFNLAWVTDHVAFGGATAAAARNPVTAGEGVSLLSGVEGRYHKIMSTVMLGLDARDRSLLNKRGNLQPGTPARGLGPLTIVALPNRNLDSLTLQTLDSIGHIRAIELIDAAPRGLGQFDREEKRVRQLAAKLDLTLVAASNNHGFGRTVAAWNLVRVPGWRAMNPDSLGRLVEERLRSHDSSSVGIVMRTRPRTHEASLILTLPVMAYQILGTLTGPEVVAWLAWTWGIALLAMHIRNDTKRRSAF